jgi:hypothetical protein
MKEEIDMVILRDMDAAEDDRWTLKKTVYDLIQSSFFFQVGGSKAKTCCCKGSKVELCL